MMCYGEKEAALGIICWETSGYRLIDSINLCGIAQTITSIIYFHYRFLFMRKLYRYIKKLKGGRIIWRRREIVFDYLTSYLVFFWNYHNLLREVSFSRNFLRGRTMFSGPQSLRDIEE